MTWEVQNCNAAIRACAKARQWQEAVAMLGSLSGSKAEFRKSKVYIIYYYNLLHIYYLSIVVLCCTLLQDWLCDIVFSTLHYSNRIELFIIS